MAGPYPPEITGPTEGDIGKEYEYTVVTTDPADGDVSYWVDWGDGSAEEWIGPFASGEEVKVRHTWYENGTYSIRAKARNEDNVEGGWSNPFIVTIFAPELKISLIKGGLFRANVAIKNIGGAEATDVNWSIKFDGGVFIGAETTGIENIIPGGGDIKVTSDFIFGLGPTIVTVTAEEPYGSLDTRQQDGFVFLFFIKVNPGGGI